MKKTLIITLIIGLFFACNRNKVISDPQVYNDEIMSIIYTVQFPLDTLELELLEVKKNIESQPSDSFVNFTQIDTANLIFLHNRAVKNVKKALKDIEKLQYKNGDTDFKPLAIKALRKLDTSLSTNFDTLIFIIKNAKGKKNYDVLTEMFPYGKKSYKDFEAAFDTLFVGQRKFDVKNGYILQRNYVMFHL